VCWANRAQEASKASVGRSPRRCRRAAPAWPRRVAARVPGAARCGRLADTRTDQTSSRGQTMAAPPCPTIIATLPHKYKDIIILPSSCGTTFHLHPPFRSPQILGRPNKMVNRSAKCRRWALTSVWSTSGPGTPRPSRSLDPPKSREHSLGKNARSASSRVATIRQRNGHALSSPSPQVPIFATIPARLAASGKVGIANATRFSTKTTATSGSILDLNRT